MVGSAAHKDFQPGPFDRVPSGHASGWRFTVKAPRDDLRLRPGSDLRHQPLELDIPGLGLSYPRRWRLLELVDAERLLDLEGLVGCHQPFAPSLVVSSERHDARRRD